MRKLSIFIIAICLSACTHASKKTQSTNPLNYLMMNDSIKKDDSKYIYWMHTSSRGCQYEILINEISAFQSIADYDIKANDCSMQINSFLKNGKNEIRIKMLPLYKKTTVDNGAIEARISCNPKNDFYNIIKQKTFTSHNTDDKAVCTQIAQLPYYESADTLTIENIPEVEGWYNSVNLAKENKDSLKAELYRFYGVIHQILKNKDVNGYLKLIEARERYMAWMHIFTDSDADSHFRSIVSTVEDELYTFQPLPPIELTTLRFEAYGNLVSLVDKDGRDIIQYLFENEEVKRLTMMNFRMHRKNIGDKLEVIY